MSEQVESEHSRQLSLRVETLERTLHRYEEASQIANEWPSILEAFADVINGLNKRTEDAEKEVVRLTRELARTSDVCVDRDEPLRPRLVADMAWLSTFIHAVQQADIENKNDPPSQWTKRVASDDIERLLSIIAHLRSMISTFERLQPQVTS